MIYFPPPNYEYEPTINIGPYFTASTGSTPATTLTCNVPRGNIGDRLVLFIHAKYSVFTTVLVSTPGWIGVGGVGYQPTFGQTSIAGKISDGSEATVTVSVEGGGGNADIAMLVMRLKGELNPLVVQDYYESGSGYGVADGVAMPEHVIVQRPVIKNYLSFGFFGGLVNTPYTSSDTPTTHSYLTTINTANTSAIITYRKGSDPETSQNVTWTPTAGPRNGAALYFLADQRAIGAPQPYNLNSGSIPNTDPHYLMVNQNNHFSHKAQGYEEVYEFSVRINNYATTVYAGEIEMGLYDITNGTNGATLCTSGTITKIVPNGVNKVQITPYKLTPGRIYATAIRTSLRPPLLTTTSYSAEGALRRSTLTGSQKLASVWEEAATHGSSRLSFGASIRFVNPGVENVINPLQRKLEAAKKPRYPTIDWTNPITRGLAALYVPEDQRKNLVTNQVSTESTITIRGFPEGLALLDSKLDFPFPPTRNGLRQQISVLFFGIVDPTGYEQLMTISDLTNTYNDILPLCRNSAINQSWQVQWLYGSRTTAASFSAAGFWEDKVIAGAFARKRSGSNQFHRFFKNGKFHSDGPTAPAFSYTGVNNQFRFAGQQIEGNRVKRTYLIAIWDRDLTDAELCSVTENPYQLLTDVSSKYYYPQNLINPPVHIRNIGDNSLYPGESNIQIVGSNISSISDIAIGELILSPTFNKINLPELNEFLNYDIKFGQVDARIRRRR